MNAINEKQVGITDLPSASGKRFTRKKWNIYKMFRKNIYYYHLQPFVDADILIEENINPDRGSEIVRMYNKKAEDDKIKK